MMTRACRLLPPLFLALIGAVTPWGMAVAQVDCMGQEYQCLLNRGGGVSTGECPDDGRFVMVVLGGAVQNDSGVSMEMTRARALRELAAYFGSEVTAQSQTTEAESYSSTDGSETHEESAVYSSSVSERAAALLRGLRFYGSKTIGDDRFVAFVVLESPIAMQTDPTREDAGLTAAVHPPLKGVVTVAAHGTAPIDGEGNVDEARRRALREAEIDALTQVLGATVVSTTDVRDFDSLRSSTFAHTMGYIERYTVLREEVREDFLSIEIEADVSPHKLYQDYRAHMRAIGRPKIAIDAQRAPECADALAGFLAGLGFEIVGNGASAAYRVEVNGQASAVKHPLTKETGTRYDLSIRLVQKDDGVELLTVTADPRRCTTFVGTGRQQVTAAAEKAFANIADKFHIAINDVIIDLARYGRRLNIYFDCAPSYCNGRLMNLSEALRQVGGVCDVGVTSDEGEGLVVVSVRYVGESEVLQERVNDILATWQCRPSVRLTYLGANEIWFAL